MRKLEAKLAAVLDDHLVAFNAGTNAGVSEGDTVRIYNTIEVKDPDSGSKLGSVSISKLRFRVNHVQAKLCVAIVVDFEEPSRQANKLTPRRLKSVTLDPSSDDAYAVYVKIGERAVIELSKGEEEPPF